MVINKDTETLRKIHEALEEVRPFLQADGGDIDFLELTDDWVVKVRLTGACGTCSVSSMTLTNGVEVVIKRSLPQVRKVLAC
tara:strand:+ start:1389 stop:1634 length:246 start_codon:yes stop_codon:yes gene_type:complete